MSEQSDDNTIRGRFANMTDDSYVRLARRVQLPEAELRNVIREARWKEAREWLTNYFRPWLYAIHDRQSAEAARYNWPPVWITGDEHIDKTVSAFATHVAVRYAERYQERRARDREIAQILPPRGHLRRHERRALERATMKAR